MKKTLSRFKTTALALALLVLGSFTAQAASTLGFNYWPTGYDNSVLDNVPWTANKARAQRELDHMASLGCGVIRLMLYPQDSGWWLQQTTQVCGANGGTNGPGGSVFCSNFTDGQTTNIVELINMCKARNMKVIVAFANYFQGTDNTGHYLWRNFYLPLAGNDDILAYTHFLWDVQHWIDGYVNSIQANPSAASNVLYYDIQNEYYRGFVYSDWYSTFVFDWSAIPEVKAGHSVLSVADAEALRVAMGARTLHFTDIHCYPRTNTPESNLEWAYDQMRAKFPSSTTIMGEFGAQTPTYTEGQQQDTVKDVATRAKNKGIPYHVHWTFLDGSLPPTENYALGFSDHVMKDAMGGLSSVENLIYNPDLELLTGGVPTSWGFGSSSGNNTTFTAGGPSQANACTNSYYGRITRTAASGSVWMNVPPFNATNPSGKKLYLNFFLRSSMTNIYPAIYEYDSGGHFIRTQTGVSYTPSTWMWYNYLACVGTQSFPLATNTSLIRISIVGTSMSNPSYLDVDTISAFAQ
jgi:hypothetical protein